MFCNVIWLQSLTFYCVFILNNNYLKKSNIENKNFLKEHNVVKIGQGAKLNVAYNDNSNLQWYLPVWGNAIGWKWTNSEFWLDALQARREALKPVTKMDLKAKTPTFWRNLGFHSLWFPLQFLQIFFSTCIINMCTGKRARESTLLLWCPKKIVEKNISNQIYCHEVNFSFFLIIIVILQKPNFFMLSMSKRLDFSQVSVLLSAPNCSALWKKAVPETSTVHLP